ncbi:MAG TPA: M28 family peptidase [Acidobacteriota bacterium]|nr:M28 family peptidase [Acidobacteriota bacterium]
MLRRFSFMWVLLLLSSALGAGSALPEGPSSSDRLRRQALDSITAEELRRDVEFLSSNRLQGRAADSPGNRESAYFLARRMEELGLQPAGDAGGYFQYVPLVRSRLLESNRLVIRQGVREIKLQVQETFTPERYSSSGEASGPLLFAGYGVQALEIGYDDYRGVEAQGKIVVLAPGSPSGEERPEDLELEKLLTAQEQGAAGVIVLDFSNNLSLTAGLAWPKDLSTQRYLHSEDVARVKIPAVRASLQVLEQPLLEAGLDVEDVVQQIEDGGEPLSRALAGLGAEIEVSLEREAFKVRNVLARLPGRDPELAHEAVVLGAHFDHLGRRGATVYNGADDNASGVAALLEIAQALTQGGRAPRRSVLFAAFNAEEKGLLGSRHYVRHPSVPLEDTAAMFQMDMIGRNEEVPDADDYRFTGLDLQEAAENAKALNVLGYSRSDDLRQLVNRNNRRVLLLIRFRYDNHPIGLLHRSDQWPFLQHGVPSLLFTTGLHPDYHRPDDTPEKLNYPKLEQITQLVYLCLWEAADSPTRPSMGTAPADQQPQQ